MELYMNIKRRRKELNMTQEQLAHKMGYTDRSSIAKIESGKVDLPQSKLEQFAKVLHTTPGELMGTESESFSLAEAVFLNMTKNEETPAVFSERERKIMRATELLEQYSEEDLLWVIQMLEKMSPNKK